MPELQALRADHARSVLDFELANRAYFAAFVSDRGDDYFQHFTEQFDALLAAQVAGAAAFYVLLAEDGSVMGRFNLELVGDGTAKLGYRVAENVSGQGVATSTVLALCRLASKQHGVRTITAAAARANAGSQRVLLKAGFVATGPADPSDLGGKPGTWYQRELTKRAEDVAADFRWQAGDCRALGSAMYGALLDRCADDLMAGGPTASVLAGHFGYRRRDVLPLRLLAGVHSVVLTGRAPGLAAFYPSTGGHPHGGDQLLWNRFRSVLSEQRDPIRSWLGHAPQTNEVGRGAALAGGLAYIAGESSLPVRLVEIGASAGLNLRADRFRIAGDAGTRGPMSSPLVLRHAWQGAAPPQSTADVVARVGVDIAPIDPTTAAGRLRLKAFVWADQPDRHARLDAALEIAADVPAGVIADDAVDAVRQLTLVEGTWTVLWHSVFRQYLDAGQRTRLEAAITALGRRATATARFAHLTLEPEPTSSSRSFPVVLTTWPGGRRRTLATAPAHGLPVTWLADAALGRFSRGL